MRTKNFNQSSTEEEIKKEIRRLEKKIERIQKEPEIKSETLSFASTPTFSKKIYKYAAENRMRISETLYKALKETMEKEA